MPLVVKSQAQHDHFEDLRTVFMCLKKYNLKLNPLKCTFGVSSEKFLGFIARHRGIEIDPSKIKVMWEIPPLKNLKQSDRDWHISEDSYLISLVGVKHLQG